MERSEYIDIDEPRETIVIEKLDGRTIVEGSHLYCGMCGRTLGTMRESITFPFTSIDLIQKMQFRTFLHGARRKGGNVRGIAHAMCNNTLFLMKDKWDFISMKDYKTQIFKDKLGIKS